MTDEDGRREWHDQPGVMWAAGAAAVALVGLLVFAVVRTAGDSAYPAPITPPATSPATTAGATLKTASATTSYGVPSVQTSQATAPEVPGPPPEASTEDAPDDSATSSTPTTIYNPYVTTTPPAAGHV
ncbi:MAG TPA: hypothetical protein VGO30_18205 [Mycobacterium sp.]|nr:hypothetical protein [Mycobacterium sp.]